MCKTRKKHKRVHCLVKEECKDQRKKDSTCSRYQEFYTSTNLNLNNITSKFDFEFVNDLNFQTTHRKSEECIKHQ